MIMQQAGRKSKSRPRGNRVQPPLVWCGLLSARMTSLLVCLLGIFISGTSVIYTTHQSRNLFDELQGLQDQRNELEVQWGQLLIEQSTFGVEGRIERKAVEELQMEVPELGDIVMVKYE